MELQVNEAAGIIGSKIKLLNLLHDGINFLWFMSMHR
jgi:hypothetical protein